MNKKDIVERLIDLKENNPDLIELIEEKFPETINDDPFVYNGAIFMKRQYTSNVYQVFYDTNKYVFRIRNITENTVWSGTKDASNLHTDGGRRFLNKTDFNNLLKQSLCNLSNIKFISEIDLQHLYKELFDK